MERAIKLVVALLPLIFAFGFLAPAIAQGMDAMALDAPFGLSSLVFGLIVAGSWGLVAQLRGRWL